MPCPIPSHPEAWVAAEGALCAGAQNSFWPMHDLLFARQAKWSREGLSAERLDGYAASLKLDVAAFRACTTSDAVAPLLVNDLMRISGAGIGGTPTFILNGEHAITGAQPLSEFQSRIDALLGEKDRGLLPYGALACHTKSGKLLIASSRFRTHSLIPAKAECRTDSTPISEPRASPR